MIRLIAPALAVVLLLAAPAAAQPASPEARSDPALDAHLAFVGEVGRVSAAQIDAMKRVVDARPLIDSLGTPAGVRANGAKVRALLAQTRQALVAVGERVKAISAPETSFAPIKPASIVADLSEQNGKMIALLADYEALLAAAERGDTAAYSRLVPKASSGAFVLLDSMRLIYRNRQSAVPANRSAYQALGVGMQLYRAMAAAGRAWYNARLARQPDVAVQGFRTAIAGMPETLRALGRDGRANVARELAELDRVTPGASAQELQTIGRLRAATAERGKLFDVGEQIALWAERAQSVTAAQLAAEANPALMQQLVPLELRFQTIANAEAALAAGRTP